MKETNYMHLAAVLGKDYTSPDFPDIFEIGHMLSVMLNSCPPTTQMNFVDGGYECMSAAPTCDECWKNWLAKDYIKPGICPLGKYETNIKM